MHCDQQRPQVNPRRAIKNGFLAFEQKEWPHAMETGELNASLQIGHSVAASSRLRLSAWKRGGEDGPATALEKVAMKMTMMRCELLLVERDIDSVACHELAQRRVINASAGAVNDKDPREWEVAPAA